jgi:hypothetical protein
MSMNETLSWDKHIETLARKVSTACSLVRSSKTYMCNSSLKIIYYAFFHLLMTYAIILWGTPHIALQFFAYRRGQFELRRDAGI